MNDLLAVLDDARERGFLGPGPIEAHIEHALGFAAAWPGPPPNPVADLGTGGGPPGLVLALRAWPDAEWVFIEANGRRARFLGDAIVRLGLGDRVIVDERRAELCGRDPSHRGRFAAVVARSFGPPAVTAECAAPLLRTGGALLTSEPPDAAEAARWPPEALRVVGLVAVETRSSPAGTYQILRQEASCPDRFPRRVGVPGKRPLW